MDVKVAQKQSHYSRRLIILIVIGIVLVVVAIASLLIRPTKQVNTFEECITAGGVRLETYPPQCSVGGFTFTSKTLLKNGDEYIHMSEQDALAKAQRSNIPARIVERNGEVLPVTMDFVRGRLNFSVKDGKVYKVAIEGQTTQ